MTGKAMKFSAAAIALAAMFAIVPEVNAGDCEGVVVGVRPLGQYNHARGNGFLAVRNGPGGSYRQIGEVYAGDLVSVWDRRGRWYAVTCMAGVCQRPLWGASNPSGWVSGRYLSISGACP